MEATWSEAVCQLGGDARVAASAATELTRRYAEPHRHYHNLTHVEAVIRDADLLAGELRLSPQDRARLLVAAGAHDVIYDGQPGRDERRSAAWARDWLRQAGVAEPHISRVEELVLATLTHTAREDDLAAHALLDADLAILGADRDTYERYRAGVRAEYSSVPDEAWRVGRGEVLSKLLARNPLYLTEVARSRWEAAAKANLARELSTVNTPEDR